MKKTTERAAEAQAENFRTLKKLVEEGIEDVRAGNVAEWKFEGFLREARTFRQK
jgi:hypothetical protein